MAVMETSIISEESELVSVAQTVIEHARTRTRTGAVVVALYGDLGAGKTAFVKALARTLGITEEVTSPTFVLMKLYALPEASPFAQLVHIDAYRVETHDEMRVLHFEELLQKEDTIICIEWADKIEALLPEDAVRMRMAIKDAKRVITIE